MYCYIAVYIVCNTIQIQIKYYIKIYWVVITFEDSSLKIIISLGSPSPKEIMISRRATLNVHPF